MITPMTGKKEYQAPEMSVFQLQARETLLTVSGSGEGLGGDISYGGEGYDDEEGD